jgi:hypothetical protein
MRAHGFFTRAHMERGWLGVGARMTMRAYLAVHAVSVVPFRCAFVSRRSGVFLVSIYRNWKYRLWVLEASLRTGVYYIPDIAAAFADGIHHTPELHRSAV